MLQCLDRETLRKDVAVDEEDNIKMDVMFFVGDRGSTVVKVLCFKSEDR